MTTKTKRIGYTAIGTLVVAVGAVLLSRRSVTADRSEQAQAAEASVMLGKVVRTTLHAYVNGFGTVEPQPATSGQPPASAKIGVPVAGLVAESRAVEGERVQKGATLFQLDSRVADVQVEKARQSVEFAQRAFERQQHLLSVEGTSKKLYQDAEQQLQAARYELANATAQRALLTIQAPITGTVIHVAAKPGDAVDPTSALAEIVDMNRLVVTAKIRTSDVSALRPGQRADISPGRAEAPEQSANLPPVAAATVSFIGADVDPANDTVTVRASLPTHSGLRPGQFVTLRVGVGEHRDRLAVPEDSVVTDVGSSNASIAVVKDNVADKVPVKLGIRDNGLVEIEGAGVSEGTVVVTGGAYSLPDHTHVRPIGQ
jgi:membrane fusion protein, multidrug efflux system